MSFNWHNFATVATDLKSVGGGGYEAQARIATNSLYYSVLILARNYVRDVENESLVTPTPNPNNPNIPPGTHARVIYIYTNRSRPLYTPNHGIIGANLKNFRTLREQASYDDTIRDPDDLWDTVELLYNKILRTLRNLPNFG